MRRLADVADTVYLGGYRARLRLGNLGRERMAVANFFRNTITINRKLDPRLECVIFFHELGHIIYDYVTTHYDKAGHINLSADAEERCVDLAAWVFVDLIGRYGRELERWVDGGRPMKPHTIISFGAPVRIVYTDNGSRSFNTFAQRAEIDVDLARGEPGVYEIWAVLYDRWFTVFAKPMETSGYWTDSILCSVLAQHFSRMFCAFIRDNRRLFRHIVRCLRSIRSRSS